MRNKSLRRKSNCKKSKKFIRRKSNKSIRRKSIRRKSSTKGGKNLIVC